MKHNSKMQLLSLMVKPAKIDCKFTGSCDLYSNESYTCTHEGGGYCGRYRKLNGSKLAADFEGKTSRDIIKTPSEPLASMA